MAGVQILLAVLLAALTLACAAMGAHLANQVSR